MTLATDIAPRVGEYLVRHGYITSEQLDTALARQNSSGSHQLIGEIVVELEFCSEDQVAECLAAAYGVPYAKLEARLCDLAVVGLLPREYIEKNLVLPLFRIDAWPNNRGHPARRLDTPSRFGRSRPA